jgi:hypothetical protein
MKRCGNLKRQPDKHASVRLKWEIHAKTHGVTCPVVDSGMGYSGKRLDWEDRLRFLRDTTCML